MTKEKVLNNISELYNNLDHCVTKLCMGRGNKDSQMEGEALFTMEGLIVACLQELSYLHDYIKNDLIEKEND